MINELLVVLTGKISCEACKKKCKKEAVKLQDKYYHVSCFSCKGCSIMSILFTVDNTHRLTKLNWSVFENVTLIYSYKPTFTIHTKF